MLKIHLINRYLFRLLVILIVLVVMKKLSCERMKWQYVNHVRKILHEVYRKQNPESAITKNRAESNLNRKVMKRIAVNVIACDRTNALRELLNNISRLLINEKSKFGVIVNLGCANDDSAKMVETFSDFTTIEPEWRNYQFDGSTTSSHQRALSMPYLARMSSESRQKLLTNGGQKEYTRLSNQYRHSLLYSFDIFNYDYAIFIEENSKISKDFFEYFEAGTHLLARDPTLFCITAWNDNGVPSLVLNNNSLLWRTGFFSGVGWMISSSTWNDLVDEWPSLFWDEWMRNEMRYSHRACIRPELSRIAINDDDLVTREKRLIQKSNNAVRDVVLNELSYKFTADDLRHLLSKRYDAELKKRLENAIVVDENEILTLNESNKRPKSAMKIYCKTAKQFERLSALFGDVFYSQGDLCSTCYNGVMQFYWRSVTIFIMHLYDQKV